MSNNEIKDCTFVGGSSSRIQEEKTIAAKNNCGKINGVTPGYYVALQYPPDGFQLTEDNFRNSATKATYDGRNNNSRKEGFLVEAATMESCFTSHISSASATILLF